MYSIPIIPPDLRHEETIVQAAYALDCLNKTINLIFEKIDRRIEKNNVKVKDLDERIQLAQAKIKGLVGTKKAIKIYAPSRFPSTHVFHDIPVTFANPATKPAETTEDEVAERKFAVLKQIDNRAETLQAKEEKLVFFHVRSNKLHSSTDLMQIRMQAEENSVGKGKPESQLRSVPSLLLFNTDDCVYGEHSDKDESWQRAKLSKLQRQQRQATTVQNKQLLESAPHSLLNRNQMRSTPAGELRYMPKANEAPVIDLPMDLPDLPGIADDIHFEANAQQQIAPSYFSDNLPDLEELERANRTENLDKSSLEQPEANVSSSSATKTLLPPTPPPPPPPPPAPSKTSADSIGAEAIAAAQLPPPPPPPPVAQASSTANENVKTVQPPDVHSALMDAIRRAGGTRGGLLRASSPTAAAEADTIDVRLDKLTQSKPTRSSASISGDLMSDLHNKLQMRRKGISGANSNTHDGSTSNKENRNANTNDSIASFNPIMTRLSALIPQTHVADRQQNAGDDDDTDWTE